MCTGTGNRIQKEHCTEDRFSDKIVLMRENIAEDRQRRC